MLQKSFCTNAFDSFQRAQLAQGSADPDLIARLRHQIAKLEIAQSEIEKAHATIRDKVDRQQASNVLNIINNS